MTNNIEANIDDAEGDNDLDEREGGICIGDIYLPPPPPPACTFDSNEPRLVISHIENEFFKSYAGRQVLGPFHKNFSAIVGPNGSGKSNVIDSMLFVFGYRAQKIRSKKVSVLIHNSETHSHVQSCSVSVHFEKIIDKSESDFEIVPDSQFVISRVAFKDNSSYYQINGKKCQFKAVAKMLQSFGIDLKHNRFLILQGEVEQIALMKPKAVSEHDTGMLEFLEDIIGSSRFKSPIELLSKRVEELSEQRNEKLNRVKLVEKEKDELEGPITLALDHLRLDNDVARKNNMLFQLYILGASRRVSEIETKRNEVEDGIKDLKTKLGELDQEKKNLEKEIKLHGSELEKVSKLKEECSEQFKTLESEDNKLQEDLKHKNQKRKKLISSLTAEQKKLEEYIKVPEKNEADIKECEELRNKLHEEKAKEEARYHEAMSSLNSETQQLQDEKEKLETKLIDLRKLADEAKSGLDIIQTEHDIYVGTEKKEKERYELMCENLKKYKDLLSTKRDEIKTHDNLIVKYEREHGTCKKKLEIVTNYLIKVENSLQVSRAKLEETRSAMHATRSKGKVLDAILHQKQTGKINGIYSRLGDLGCIDEKYDVAISTACGALDHIVVDTVDTGQKCIEFLKRNNIGTATFICLDKMEKWRSYCNKPIHTPEDVPRLFDLVKVNDEKVKTAFYFALRNTLVADDLNQATRIAYGKDRNRVATLKGELIELAGTMSGGGRTVFKGRMGKAILADIIDPKEVSILETEVDKQTADVTTLRREKSDLEDKILGLEKEIKANKTNVTKFTMDLDMAKQQIDSLNTQLPDQNKKVHECSVDPKEVTRLQKEIDIKKKESLKANKLADELSVEVEKIHKQIIEITGGRMKHMKKKVDDINKKIEKVNAEVTRLQVAIKTSKRNCKKTEEKILSMETEIKEVESEFYTMQARRAAIEEEATEVLSKLEKTTGEENNLIDRVQELKGQHNLLSKEENKIKSSKIEVDEELEKYESEIKENKSKMSSYKKQLSKTELQVIPVNKTDEDELPLKQYEENELDEMDCNELKYQLNILKEKLNHSKPNLAVIQDYKNKEEVYYQRLNELKEISKEREIQRKYHEDLRKERLNEFMEGFLIISNKLREMYQTITLGGDAELELVDSLDPFSEGIVFSVRPPKKSWKNITNLSGGEKTLSSLALVFALHYYKPTPLYVMDEIDAALDFKNVSIIGNHIKERTKNAQFIIISLRSQMFELADRLVGIYKVYNCTKSVAINPAAVSEM